MNAKNVTKLCDILGISETELFDAAYEDATGMKPMTDRDVVIFQEKGVIPQYVEDYIKHILYPRFIIRRSNEDQKETPTDC